MRQRDVILVTGGSGLVGSAIAEEVRLRGTQDDYVFISSSDADLTDLSETRLIFEKYKPSYVINLAAKVGGLFANMKNNDEFYDLNMKINENVLRTSLDFKVKKCVSCLSTCIFPDQVELPLDESKAS